MFLTLNSKKKKKPMLLSKWKLRTENVNEALAGFLCYKGFESIDIICIVYYML